MKQPPVRITDTLTFEELIEEIEVESVILHDLKLDILTLDESWIEQPHISFKWNRLSNQGDFCLRTKERELKEVEAERYLFLKQSHIEAGEKCTEASLVAEISSDAIVCKLREDISYMQYVCVLLVSAKKAIDDRRRALEGLTSLFTTQYFTSIRDNPVMRELAQNTVGQIATEALENNQRLRKLRDKKKEKQNG